MTMTPTSATPLLSWLASTMRPTNIARGTRIAAVARPYSPSTGQKRARRTSHAFPREIRSPSTARATPGATIPRANASLSSHSAPARVSATIVSPLSPWESEGNPSKRLLMPRSVNSIHIAREVTSPMTRKHASGPPSTTARL